MTWAVLQQKIAPKEFTLGSHCDWLFSLEKLRAVLVQKHQEDSFVECQSFGQQSLLHYNCLDESCQFDVSGSWVINSFEYRKEDLIESPILAKYSCEDYVFNWLDKSDIENGYMDLLDPSYIDQFQQTSNDSDHRNEQIFWDLLSRENLSKVIVCKRALDQKCIGSATLFTTLEDQQQVSHCSTRSDLASVRLARGGHR